MTEQHKNFTLEQVGKRMPYRVPEGFFDTLADNTLSKATRQPPVKHISPLHRYSRAIYTAAVAAVLAAMLFTVDALRPNQTTSPGNTTIEEAFSNLSSADQEYIIDTFMNEMIIDAQ